VTDGLNGAESGTSGRHVAQPCHQRWTDRLLGKSRSAGNQGDIEIATILECEINQQLLAIGRAAGQPARARDLVG